MTGPLPTRIVVIVGTRPEAIKLAPVILALNEDERFDPFILATGQHAELALDALSYFGIEPHQDLGVMEPGQSLAQLSAKLLHRVTATLQAVRPAVVVVQGDTTSAAMGALAAFYEKIPVAHVEAGLRTYDRSQPFPEEANRQLISRLTDVHFAPTASASSALHCEGVSPLDVLITGNTIVDALEWTRPKLAHCPICKDTGWVRVDKRCDCSTVDVLVTCHRRENRDEQFERLMAAVVQLARRASVLFVGHPARPAIELYATLHDCDLRVLPALSYPSFVRALATCRIVITDSGGIQEEAPTFGKPVLVFRQSTERPEAIEAGTARLVTAETLIPEALRLLRDPAAYEAMSTKHSPFGDGKAAPRIVSELARRFIP